MKRIGKLLSVIGFYTILLTISPIVTFAQPSATVQASLSQTSVYTGERITFDIEVSGDFNNVSRPELPDFKAFRLLSNTPSTSRSFRYINGQSSTSYTYSYYLIAQKKGSYQIPPAQITIDGETYRTKPIEVTIVDRNTSAQSAGSQNPDIFLRLEISDQKPVTGQQIIADVILFFKDGLEVSSYQPVPGWKAQGFWKEELENASRPQATSTIIDGVRYRKARLLQFSLFPTKEGELTISPYKIIVAVQSSRNNNSISSLFGGFGTNRRHVELATDPVSVDVQPLPPTDSYYLGAVGYFDINRTISTNNAVVGESIEITTRINGTGNIPLISKPIYELPDDLEIYEPQVNSNLNRRNQKISGSKTFADIIIARSPGNYTIPAKKVAYFNPSQNKYITKTLAALHIDVNENPNTISADNTPSTFPVRPITGLASWFTPTSTNFMTNWWFWAAIIFPLALLSVAYWQKSYLEKMNTDLAFARSQKASEKASQRLKEAIKVSEQGHIKQAYNLLSKALTGFISDRLTLPEAGLSNEDYVRALEDEDIDINLVKNVRMLLDKCASISYAPEVSHSYLKSHVGLAQSTLEKLKKVL